MEVELTDVGKAWLQEHYPQGIVWEYDVARAREGDINARKSDKNARKSEAIAYKYQKSYIFIIDLRYGLGGLRMWLVRVLNPYLVFSSIKVIEEMEVFLRISFI